MVCTAQYMAHEYCVVCGAAISLMRFEHTSASSGYADCVLCASCVCVYVCVCAYEAK
jgi:hypothetical protein